MGLVLLAITPCSPDKLWASSAITTRTVQKAQVIIEAVNPETYSITVVPSHELPPNKPLEFSRDLSLLVAVGPQNPTIELTQFEAVRVQNGKAIERITTIPLHLDGRSRIQEIVRINPAGRGILGAFHVQPILIQQRLADVPNVDEWLVWRVGFTLHLGPSHPGSQALGRTIINQIRESAPAEILNPQIDERYLNTTAPTLDTRTTAWSQWLDSVMSRGGRVWYHQFGSVGLYRLQLGPELPPAELAKVRAYVNGMEVSLVTDPEGHLYFPSTTDPANSDKATAVVLVHDPYGTVFGQAGGDRPPQPTRIRISGGDSDRPARLEAQSSSAQTHFPMVLRHREFAQYDAKLPGDRAEARWFWTQAGPETKIGDFSTTMPPWWNSTLISSATLKLQPAPTPNQVHGLFGEVLLNSIARLPLTQPQRGQLDYTVPITTATVLRPGVNRIAIIPSEKAISQSLVLRRTQLEWFQSTQCWEAWQAWIDKASGVRVLATPLHITDLLRDKRFRTPAGVIIGVPSGGGGPSLCVPLDSLENLEALDKLSTTTHEWWVEPLAEAKVAVPARVAPAFKEIIGSSPENQIIVAPRAFLPEARRLAQYRHNNQGLNVLLLTVEEVFPRYGYGEPSAFAIRECVKALWQPQLQSILLIGECSDWAWTEEARPSRVTPDLVPTFTAANHNPHGDVPYARLIGEDDFSDLAVGRLPVQTSAELAQLVDRLIDRDRFLPQNPNDLRFLQVLDDDTEFSEAAAEARWVTKGHKTEVFDQGAFGYVTNMRVEGRRRSRAATEALITTWTQPRTAVFFFGHGGPNIFSHERLIHFQDFQFLRGGPAPPIVACASCDNAWLNFPVAPVASSFGEQLVLRPGSAAAVFGPTAGATSYEHRHLMARFAEAFTNDRIRTAGDAARFASNSYFGQNLSRHVPSQYVLIGDPAMPLHAPAAQKISVPLSPIPDSWQSLPLANAPRSNPAPNGLATEFNANLGWTMSWAAGVDQTSLLSALVPATLPLLVQSDRYAARAVLEGSLTDADGQVSSTQQILNFQPGMPRRMDLIFPRPPTGTSATVHLELSAFGEDGEPIRVLSLSGSLPIKKGPNLAWIPGSGAWRTAGPAFAQSTVFLAGLLTNNGDQPTLKTEIQAWSESPTTGTVLMTTNELTGIPIPPLQPGEIREVLFRWENAINPGNHRVWLRANRPPQTRESTMEDNDLEIPPITLLPLPNMRAELLNVSPPVITPNQRSLLKFEVSDEWPGGRGPIEVQFGFENLLTGKTSTRKFTLPDLEKKQVIEGPVNAGPEPVIAFAMVNSDKEWEELDIQASRSSKPTNLLLPATTWRVSTSDASYVSLAEILPLSVPNGIRHIPGQGLAIDSAAHGIRYDILPIPSHARSMAARPNMGPDDILGRATWRFRDNTFQAAAVPDPSDLTLSVPVDPALAPITTASLYVEVALGQIPGVIHEFSLSSSPDRPFVPVSVPPDPNRQAKWVSVGPVTITSGVVNLRVRPGIMRECSIGRIGVLTPTASAVSPWLEVPADWNSGVVRIQPIWLYPPEGESHPDSAHVEIRTATQGADPSNPLQAGPWVRPNSGEGFAEVHVTPQTVAIQWRLIMHSRHTMPPPNAKSDEQPKLSFQGMPILADIRLEYRP